MKTAICNSLLRDELKTAFQAALNKTEQLFALVHPDAYNERPIPLRHPIVFYEGHLPAFTWNTLFGKVLQRESLNPAFDQLFARGIDPSDQDTANKFGHPQWPSRAAILDYKQAVYSQFFDFLEAKPWPEHTLLKNGYVLWLILEHERMHQETLLYILHQLPSALKQKPTDFRPVQDTPIPHQAMVEVTACTVFLGAQNNEFDFTWDNEHPRMESSIDAFLMDAYPVTNGQFLAFIEAGGYERPEFWTPEAWQWKTSHNQTHPFFWRQSPEGWLLKDFFDVIPLPLSWPVYVTHAEALAYARFVGKDLPTEAEWHRAAYGDTPRPYPWGQETPTADHGNFGFNHWSPMPVGSYPKGATPTGLYDMLGNGWEWTSTPFMPFPGFQPSEAYPQYSEDFFDGQHYVLKGGSQFTDTRLLRHSFRNWFYWHYPYMYATFRCISR